MKRDTKDILKWWFSCSATEIIQIFRKIIVDDSPQVMYMMDLHWDEMINIRFEGNKVWYSSKRNKLQAIMKYCDF